MKELINCRKKDTVSVAFAKVNEDGTINVHVLQGSRTLTLLYVPVPESVKENANQVEERGRT